MLGYGNKQWYHQVHGRQVWGPEGGRGLQEEGQRVTESHFAEVRTPSHQAKQAWGHLRAAVGVSQQA